MLVFRVSRYAASVSVRSSAVSGSAGPTSRSSSAAPRLCPEQGGQDKGEEGEQAGDHVDHQRLLRQLRRVREGGGGRQGRTH